MSRIRPLLFALVLAFAFAACDSTDEFQIGGTYAGVTNTTLGTATLTVTVPDTPSGDTFSFSGSLVEADENGRTQSNSPLRGTGTYDHPDISITVEGETLSGTANDAGDRLTLDDDTGLGAFVLVRR